MNYKYIAILCVLFAIIGAVLSHYLYPKIETKTVEVTKDVVKYNVITKVVTVKHPDGTEETTTETEDHSVKENTKNKIDISNKVKDWQISLSIEKKINEQTLKYGLQIQRRILGPIYLGTIVDTDKNIGISLGFEF